MEDKNHKSTTQPVTFKKALLDFWKRAFDFSGVTKLGEFWWIEILSIGISFAVAFLSTALVEKKASPVVILIILLLFFIFLGFPSISLSIRRLRDVGLANLGILGIFVLSAIVGVFNNIYTLNSSVDIIGTVFNLVVFYVSLRPTDNYTTTHKSGWRSKVFRQQKVDTSKSE
ncbi:DUF805 domain-containing protein [Ligilactobacillus pobuzihii]|uniref:DUF805 domain-containing protein n=1 Tax=Ligilactobacillus pobuzihii TaxID=449659 RepID=UPI0019D1F456|nr:DUF805 domain-containing protein [Ligilactobacillus pobuzihii]MBN7274244.1 DUF805 domain-containing protein [Ligilactobacillus pobuzihii]